MRLYARKKAELQKLPWPEFWKQLPAFMKAKETLSVQRLGRYGRCFLCAIYFSPLSWDVWVQDTDPRDTITGWV